MEIGGRKTAKSLKISMRKRENQEKDKKNGFFPLTNRCESRIVNGGGMVFTRINTGFLQRASVNRALKYSPAAGSGRPSGVGQGDSASGGKALVCGSLLLLCRNGDLLLLLRRAAGRSCV